MTCERLSKSSVWPRGGYYPSLDLDATAGREKIDTPNTSSDAYHPDSTRLTLTQMLFDGFSTRNEVARLGFEKLASYYDFQQTAEETALEVIQAYHDVIRYRELVNLAKENYIQHRLVFDDIQERVTSGLGRRVDLEQATGRLALAESNLLTERTNLHDVTIRFQRLVGVAPADLLETIELPVDLIPESQLDALEKAYLNNAQLSAAIERIRAVRAEMKRKNSAMMPRLDLRLRQELDHDTDGVEGRFEEQAVELVLSYNLYNGGSDSASKRQSFELLNQAKSLRDKACRDVRQEVLIAHNDIGAQQQQVAYLDRNQAAIGKARQAYRKQFDIGQRTLLDLLDTENEYFETRRTLVNAETDLILARARTLEAMGVLLRAFSLRPEVLSRMEALELFDDDDRRSMLGRCEIEAPQLQTVDNDQLLSELFDDPRFRKNEAGKAAFNLDVKFAYNSSVVSPDEDQRLREAAEFLQKYPRLTGVIEGHTDDVGSENYNKALSQSRAVAVRDYLVNKLGVASSRLQAVGYGESRPMASNDSDSGRSINRRVELVLETEVPARKPRLSDFTDFRYDEDKDKLQTSDSLHNGWQY
ncbi:MAG: hypothetical protein Aseana_13580 [Candidatus Pelagadaptatus aseana]